MNTANNAGITAKGRPPREVTRKGAAAKTEGGQDAPDV